MAQAPASASAPVSGQTTLKAEQLEQVLAPIALYQDDVLSQVLIASTYPLEVVQADRWARDNKALKGDSLKAALEKQGWDRSIKALVAVPSVLTMMSERLDWTQKLGDAVLAQQKDVMDAIQRLRAKAHAQKKLASTQQQKVTVKTEQNKQVIVIESATPGTVYVPYYNPTVVYGAWPYPAYPPVYYPPPGYVAGTALATGLAFATGVAIGSAVWGGVNWGNNDINVNINNSNTINKWEHNSSHRRGVQYNNAELRQKYGKADLGSGSQRVDFRGRSGEQVLRPGSDRPGGLDRQSDRPTNLDRPSNLDRSGRSDRPADANRPGGADRSGRPTTLASAGPDQGGRERANAFSGMGNGNAARLSADRGRDSLGAARSGGLSRDDGPALRGGGGGGRGGGGGGGGFRRGR
jgi:hypothetical protein